MPGSRIVVVGSSNTDLIIKVDRLPRPGETVLGGEFASAPGGKGANQAVAAARLGGSVTFVARVGRDSLGEAALAAFAREGISVEHVVRDQSLPSGVALILVRHDGENSIAVASGANARLSPADVERAGNTLRAAGLLLAQLESPLETIEAAVALATRWGRRVIVNPAPARDLPQRLLRQIYLLTPNETETQMLTGVAVRDEATAAKAAEALRRRGVQNVIITLGAKGAYVACEGQGTLVPGFRVTPVDATAAGDVFNGALAVALTENQPILHAVRFANAAAAISVTRLGAQPSAPTRAEVERVLRRGRLRADNLADNEIKSAYKKRAENRTDATKAPAAARLNRNH